LVRARLAVCGHLIAEPATSEHQERLVLVTVTMRWGGALAGIDLDNRNAEAPGATGGAELAARRADLAVVPALPRDVVNVDRDVGPGHGEQDASREGRLGALSKSNALHDQQRVAVRIAGEEHRRDAGQRGPGPARDRVA